jgi:hypothetical protein
MIDLKAHAGDIMGYYKAFAGSRAAFNTDDLLIVRGKSTLRDSYKTMPDKLNDVMKLFDGEEIDINSVKAQEFIANADKQIRSEINIETGTDTNGLNRMRKDYEALGADVEMKLFQIPGVDILITTWKDKNDMGPMYVEAVLSKINDTEIV